MRPLRGGNPVSAESAALRERNAGAAASLARVLYGTDEAVDVPKSMHAGPLDVAVHGVRIGSVTLGACEVWHGVAFLLRDPDWGTPAATVDAIDATGNGAAFRVVARGHFATSPVVDFRVEIEGSEAGCIRLVGEAIPRGDIRVNRIGLCLMHPMTVCGAPIEIQHVDGRLCRSTFPTLIPPWPPFTLVRAVRHEFAPGRFARAVLEGDAFEMEDQRNNADASFKTYSRSNLAPRPYWLRAGAVVRQSVELRLEEPAVRPKPRRAEPVEIRVDEPPVPMPALGIAISVEDSRDVRLAAVLRELRPAILHLPLDAHADTVEWRGVAALLDAAGARLRLDVDVGAVAQVEPALDQLRETLLCARVAPAALAIFPSEPRCIDAARRAFPGCAIGGGTPHLFVQLNRLDVLGAVDFLTFTTSSIVHGADDASVMLTLQSLPSMVETLRARFPDARIALGPSGIGMRRSPLGGQPNTDGLHRVPLARSDPRLRGLFGAAWTLGYVAQLAASGVDAITLWSATGDAGVVERDASRAWRRHPAYFVLQRLSGAANAHDVHVSEPLRVAALALSTGGRRVLLLGNLCNEPVEVRIDDWAAGGDLAVLDAETLAEFNARERPWTDLRRCYRDQVLRLGPYAVASVERRDGST